MAISLRALDEMLCDVCGRARISAFYGAVQLRFILKGGRTDSHRPCRNAAPPCTKLKLGFRWKER